MANALIAEITNAYPSRRLEVLAAASAWLQRVKEIGPGVEARASVSPKEVAAYHASIAKGRAFIYESGRSGRGCLTPDLWLKDSPVPQDVKTIVTTDISGAEPERGAKLKQALNTWRDPSLTAQQQLIVDSIRALGSGFRALGSSAANLGAEVRTKLNTLVDGATSAAIEAGKFAVLASPAGNFVAFCEVVTGYEFCLPNGTELTIATRVLSAGGGPKVV